jgi:hypothetical protein
MKEQLYSDSQAIGSALADEYASQTEVIEAIQALTDTDHQKLMVIAKSWQRRRYGSFHGIRPEDILSEAIAKTLEGDRKWRKPKVSLVKHLDRVMESISGHIIEARKVQSKATKILHSDIERANYEQDLTSSVERQVIARQELEIIQGLFASDEVALNVLRGRAEGKTASEIRADLRLAERDYETVTKRILRVFVRYAKNLEENEHD